MLSLASRMYASSPPCRAAARNGPQLRVPVGGYLVAATARRASSALFTIGTIRPSAPRSRIWPTTGGSFHSGRTIVGSPVARSAMRARRSPSIVTAPCCMSMSMKSRPVLLSDSATSSSCVSNEVPMIGRPWRSERSSLLAGMSLLGKPRLAKLSAVQLGVRDHEVAGQVGGHTLDRRRPGPDIGQSDEREAVAVADHDLVKLLVYPLPGRRVHRRCALLDELQHGRVLITLH